MVDEQKTKEGQSPAEVDSSRGSEPEIPEVVKQANAAAERLEQANKQMAETLKQLQDLKARDILGGRSDGKVETREEDSPADYAQRVLKGHLTK